jgi:hypothetical protein
LQALRPPPRRKRRKDKFPRDKDGAPNREKEDPHEIRGWIRHAPSEEKFPGETVVFSYIVYKSRAHRDRVNAKVMKDPRLAGCDPASMPFDVKRMVYGGFKVLVDA